jgi:CheY-like chemotaxis protein
MRSLLEDWEEIKVVGEVEDGSQAVHQARKLTPDIVVMDDCMPLVDGRAATRMVRESHPGMGIVLLSSTPEGVPEAVMSGATTYVLKDFIAEDLPGAIHSAYRMMVFPADMEKLEPQWQRVMEFLYREGLLTIDRMERALQLHHLGQAIPDVLVDEGFFDRFELAEIMARSLEVPYLRLQPITVVEERLDVQGRKIRSERETDPVDITAARRISEELARRLRVIPICQSDGQILIATAEPLNEEAFAEVEEATGFRMRFVLSPQGDILDAIDRCFAPQVEMPALAPLPAVAAPSLHWWQAWRPAPLMTATIAVLCLVITAMVNVLRAGFSLELNYIIPFGSFVIGFFFFIYAMKYYITTAAVLVFSSTRDPLNGGTGNNTEEKINGYHTLRTESSNKRNPISNGNSLVEPLKRHPFVSVHLATYNEERVIDRLLTACTSFDYPNYEVVVVDDSTDATVDILRRWRSHPRVKVHYRESRSGFKGG